MIALADQVIKSVRTLVADALAPLAARIAAVEQRAAELAPAGAKGDPGEPGPAGAKGDPGERGLDGRDGRDGKDGIHGRDALEIDVVPAIDPSKSYRDTRADWEAKFEKAYVGWLLERHSFNISAAARAADMDRKYLYRLAKKHGLHPTQADDES